MREADDPLPPPATPAGRGLLARLGPGFITGVADDDPSGIATYAQAGAAFGLNLLFTMPLTYPLMAAIQSISARIGRVTGRGLAANLKAHYPPLVVETAVLLLFVANAINIAADVAAMGEVGELLTGLNRHLGTLFFTVLSLLLQVYVPYHRYVRVLRWLTLSLLAYFLVLFTVAVPWPEVLRRTLLPQLRFSAAEAELIVAVFGTTISPYLFFWQASQEVEDLGQAGGGAALCVTEPSETARRELQRIRLDTWTGMLYSNVTAYCIILSTAVTLHVAHLTTITTAAEAAQALKPLAGEFAFAVFALGVLGVGLIGVPVLSGASAYAVAETRGWTLGLERSPGEAPRFYGLIALSYALALALQFLPVDPMRALVLSATVNGVVAVPLMVLILLLSQRPGVLGVHRPTGSLLALGWLATAVMALASVRMLLPD